jgi:hypothetical protein
VKDVNGNVSVCGLFIERTWKRCSLLVVFLVSGVIKSVFGRFKTPLSGRGVPC